MKSIKYSGWIRSLWSIAEQRSDPTLKSDDLLLRKTGELQLRKIDDFKFAIYRGRFSCLKIIKTILLFKTHFYGTSTS